MSIWRRFAFQFNLRSLFLWLTVGIVVGYPLYCFVTFLTTEPSFSAAARRIGPCRYELTIAPNYVVNSIYRIRVSARGMQLYEYDGWPLKGVQHFIIESDDCARMCVVDVECELQSDRGLAVGGTTISKALALP